MQTPFNPQKVVAIDTETTGLHVMKGDRPFAVSMCDESGNTWYCQWKVNPYTREVEPDERDLGFIQNFCNGDYEIVFHNSKFDVRMLSAVGIQFFFQRNNATILHDTYIESRVYYNIEVSNELKALAWKYLRIDNTDEQDLQDAVAKARRMARQINKMSDKHILLHEDGKGDYWLVKFFDKNNDLCEKYCRLDTVRTMALHRYYQSKINADPLLLNTYKMEQQLWPIIYRMENRGFTINKATVLEELTKAEKAIEFYRTEMQKMVVEKDLKPFTFDKGELFNPRSAAQVARVMYLPERKGGLGLETEKRTKTGNSSSGKDALDELMWHPFVQHLKCYKNAAQVVSLFFTKFIELMHDGVLHPGINQCGAKTTRMSCSDPNLQQITNPDTYRGVGDKYEVRKCFEPRPGYVLIGADFEQQELKLTTIYGHIPFFLKEMHDGNDVYSALTNRVWGHNGPEGIKNAINALELNNKKPSSKELARLWRKMQKDNIAWDADTDKAMIADNWLAEFDYDIVKAEKSIGKKVSRQRCKQVLLSKTYGAGVSKIAGLLVLNKTETKKIIDQIDREVPEVSKFIQKMSQEATDKGYIVNPYSRKLYVDEDLPYKACNYLIQSTAADMMKRAIINIDSYLQKTGLDAHLLLPVHDEIILEIKKEHCHKWLLRGIAECMINTGIEFDVPMEVDFNIMRQSWQFKEKVEL